MELNIKTDTIYPSAVLTQYKLVDFDAAHVSTAGDAAYGIVRTANQAANEACEIIVRADRCYAMVDGSSTAIAVGDALTSDASGRLVKATVGTDLILAYAHEASSAAGDVIEVKFL